MRGFCVSCTRAVKRLIFWLQFFIYQITFSALLKSAGKSDDMQGKLDFLSWPVFF